MRPVAHEPEPGCTLRLSHLLYEGAAGAAARCFRISESVSDRRAAAYIPGVNQPHDKIGRFEIQAEWGRGAMGVVYRAIDPHLGRQVALKVLSPALAADEEMIARFADEARNASQLLHPNIATVFEAGPSPAGWYVAFEFVEGSTLKTLLSRGPLAVEHVTDYLLQIGEGLSAAHKAGVVHRDLKPENLIVTPEGVVKITDFGLAKRIGDPSRTSAGTILGTAYYMAPEQAKGLPVDGRADWFSLGAIAYEMATGKRPFRGYHEMAVLYAVVNEDPEPTSSRRPELPAALAEAIHAMLRKDPDTRLASVAQLRALLAPVDVSASARSIPSTIEPEATSLAVLPLENKSPDPEYVFLAEGFSEDIGAALGQAARFRVLSHDKVMAARPADASPTSWGAALRVRYILHGSLFRSGARLKLRLYLRDLSTGRMEWSQSFSGQKDDIFEFQDRVAVEVAAALVGGGPPTSIPSRGGTYSVEAYDFFLKGRDYYRREGHENLDLAMEMFDRALALDSRYAAAHAGLADAYVQMYSMYYDRDRKWLKKAETSAKAALVINPDLPEAHRALGRVMMEYGKNEDAIREFQTAIQQKPDFHEAYRTLAWIYQGMHQYSDSIDWGQKSLGIKPLDKETYLLLGLNYLDLREWDKARHHFERAIELAPDYGRAYLGLGNVAQKTGDLQGAIRLYRTALKYLTDVNAYLDLGWAQILLSDLAGARESFGHLIAAGAMEFLAFYYLGLVDTVEERHEKASARFESALAVCRKQLIHDPDNPYCLMATAQALACLGQKDEARATAERAARLETGNGALTLELARVRALLGDSEAALAALKDALAQPMGPSLFEVRRDPHFGTVDLSVLSPGNA